MLGWFENTAVGMWVDTSPWAYPFLLTVHGLGMAVVVGLTAIIAIRILGFPAKVPLGAYRALMPFLMVAFFFNALSGVVLYTTDAIALTANLSFQIKMASIVIGLVVLWRLHVVVLMDADQAESAGGEGTYVLPKSAKALAIAAVAIWWLSVIVSGRLVAYLSAAA